MEGPSFFEVRVVIILSTALVLTGSITISFTIINDTYACIALNFIYFQIRLAALNEPYTGKVHSTIRTGHSAADYECNQQSLSAGYNGNFRAFLTNR